MNIIFGLFLGVAFGVLQFLIWKSFLSKPSFIANMYKVVTMGILSIFAIFIFLLVITILQKDILIWAALGVFVSTFATSVFTYIKDRRRNK